MYYVLYIAILHWAPLQHVSHRKVCTTHCVVLIKPKSCWQCIYSSVNDTTVFNVKRENKNKTSLRFR
jgi:hypothetical protein